jgi:EAL domain-containing protein (putative c-di-GMP-specific phosphodiesterase class I)/GGDEF domain-containing protein
MLFLKYILFGFVIYILLLISTYTLFIDTYIDEIVLEEKKIAKLYINDFKNSVTPYIINAHYTNINSKLQIIGDTNRFKYINLKYLNDYVTIQNILLHSNIPLDLSWKLHDIILDSRFGTIKKINSLLYLFKSSIQYDYEDMLPIKAQASNFYKVHNIVSQVSFILPHYTNIKKEDFGKISFMYDILKSKTNLKDIEKIDTIYIAHNFEFVNISYKLNNKFINNKIYEKLENIFLYISFSFFSIFIIIILFNYQMMQNTINIYLKQLIKYTNDIANNKFYKFNSDNLLYKNIINLSLDISLISKKMASLMSEINVNKNMLEVEISTDSLTKLPTTKLFEQDMKALYLFKIESYIVKIKLICLAGYSKNNNQNKIDQLINKFVSYIKEITSQDDNISLYRIYGSEFILIAKDYSNLDTELLLNRLSKTMTPLETTCTEAKKLVHIVAIPFDKYSNTEELLNNIDVVFEDTVDDKKAISIYTQSNNEQIFEHSKLEKVVTSIIQNNAFLLTYKYDTYKYKNINELYMQEVSAKLLNYDGSKIAIGIFISVAHELDLALQFDKNLILKTFKYIQQKNISHKLAINISIDAMISEEFIVWLESKLLFDYKDIIPNIVFSITSFAAQNNFNEFIDFSNRIKEFNVKIILKRFSYNDLTIEQLDMIDVDYIRVHSDYTNSISNTKKMVLNNIVNYCLSKDIMILADMVHNNSDNDILETLGFYGTSK